jgi:hypothetical protein
MAIQVAFLPSMNGLYTTWKVRSISGFFQGFNETAKEVGPTAAQQIKVGKRSGRASPTS